MSVIEKIKEIFQNWFGLNRTRESSVAIAASVQDQAPPDLKRAPEDAQEQKNSEDNRKKETKEIKEGQDNVKEPEKPTAEPKVEEQNPADATIQLENEQRVLDARDEGYDPPVDIPYGGFKKPFTIPRELAHEFELKYPEGFTYIQVRKQAIEQSIVSEPCCIRDAKIDIHFNGHLIYAGDQRTSARESQTRLLTEHGDGNSAALNANSNGCSDCCCELPPEPTPNYCFTYTSCNGCAYITLGILNSNVEEETNTPAVAPLIDGETSDCGCGNTDESFDPKKYDEIYYIGFYPGYEPNACDCPIVEVCTNVIVAEWIGDFASNYRINGFEDIVSDSAHNEESSRKTTFEDECGVCWSIYRFEQDNQIIPEVELYDFKESGYYLLPLCISQVPIETICYVDLESFVPTISEDDGKSSGISTNLDYYDGFYYKVVETTITDSMTDVPLTNISESYLDRITFTMLEIEGNVVLSLNYEQEYSYDSSDFANNIFNNIQAINHYNLILDIDDSFSACDNAINGFITCDPIQGLLTQLFETFHFSFVSEVIGTNTALITDAEIKDASFAVLNALIDQGEGVFKDEQGNLFKLNVDGDLYDLGSFTVLGAEQTSTSLTNADIVAATDLATSTPLAVEFCGPIVERFGEWQSYTGCDSTYGNPIQYVNENFKASYIQDGDSKYIEFEYWVPNYYVDSGYYSGQKEFFRICMDDFEYSPEAIVIDAQRLFEEYYDNGYVDFYNLFYADAGSVIHIVDNQSNEFEISENELKEELGETCCVSLVPAECQNDINIYIIGGLENIEHDDGDTTLYVNTELTNYELNFQFEHVDGESHIKFSLLSTSEEDEPQSATLNIAVANEFDLDCCCGIERVVINGYTLYEYLTSNSDSTKTAEEILANFVDNGYVSFLDCYDNCYHLTSDVDNNVSLSQGEDCKQDLAFVIDGQNTVSYLDQFLDMDFISCEGNSFVMVNWYYNPSFVNNGSDLPNPEDCFNFAILQDSLMIEIDSKYQALFQDCECPLDRVVLPESVINLFENINNCQTTSDEFQISTGLEILSILDEANAPFITACGAGFDIEDGQLKPLCEMPTTFSDENDLVGYDFIANSFDDAKTAASTGEGLSLRELIILSNHYTFNEGVKNMIRLEAGQYDLSLNSGSNDEDYGDLDVTKDLIIFGAGKEVSIIDANGIDRVLENAMNSVLTMLELTVSGGEVTNGSGSGILSFGVLHLDDVIVTNNVASDITNTLSGGGVYMSEGTIRDSTISQNALTAKIAQGAGLYLVSGTVTDTMIYSNNAYADEIYGVGVLLTKQSEVSNSAIFNNNGEANNLMTPMALYGGGLLIGQNSDGSKIINVTIDSNSLSHTGGVGTSTNGSGIYDFGSNSYLSNLTVTNNESNGTADGSGVVLNGSGTTLQSSIILGNTDNSGNNNEDLKIIGTGVSGTHNISESFNLGSSTVAVTISTYSDEFGANGVADNGGPTFTVALEESTSLSINNGLAGALGDADATADQRHVTYVAVPDVGAYESPVVV